MARSSVLAERFAVGTLTVTLEAAPDAAGQALNRGEDGFAAMVLLAITSWGEVRRPMLGVITIGHLDFERDEADVEPVA